MSRHGAEGSEQVQANTEKSDRIIKILYMTDIQLHVDQTGDNHPFEDKKINHMKHFLSDSDRSYLEQRIKETEQSTNLQIVLATTGRSDNYTEIPWKAFAAGVSAAGLLVFAGHLINPVWFTVTTLLVSIVAILAIGSLSAIMTIFLPAYAGVFLTGVRSEKETWQYAASLFLERELYETGNRTGILILISKFERKIVILPDKGLDSRLHKESTENIISRMSEHMRQRKVRQAFEAGLDELTALLSGTGGGASVKNELSDEIIERDQL